MLLAGPVGWLLIAYLGSLAILFVASLWQLDDFSGEIVRDPGFQNFKELIETPVYRSIVFRTVLIATLVTITDAILALPIAFYMAKVATFPNPGPLTPNGSSAQFTMPSFWSMIRQV